MPLRKMKCSNNMHYIFLLQNQVHKFSCNTSLCQHPQRILPLIQLLPLPLLPPSVKYHCYNLLLTVTVIANSLPAITVTATSSNSLLQSLPKARTQCHSHCHNRLPTVTVTATISYPPSHSLSQSPTHCHRHCHDMIFTATILYPLSQSLPQAHTNCPTHCNNLLLAVTRTATSSYSLSQSLPQAPTHCHSHCRPCPTPPAFSADLAACW